MALPAFRLLQHLLLPGTALLLSGLPLPLLAHPGRVNGQGCHNNRSTGDYHCHGGADYGGGGGGSSAPPAPAPRTPVCRDVAVQVVTVALTRLNAAGQPVIWKQQRGVNISRGTATLGGVTGQLSRYNVDTSEANDSLEQRLAAIGQLSRSRYNFDTIEVRNFIAETAGVNRYSLNRGDWIPVRAVRQEEGVTISILEANPLNIHSEEFRSSTESRQVCS